MPRRGRFPRRRARRSHGRLSELLDRLAHEDDSERIAFGGLLDAVGERAFGALILVFSIPAVMVGMIPGISALLVLTSIWAERGIGLCCFMAAALVFLPIPFGNLLPAIALCAFGLALMERDGVLALDGLPRLIQWT